MCTTECHILKYLDNRLKIIYYNDPAKSNKPNNVNNTIAMIIYDDQSQQIWFRLNQGINVINNDIKIIWESRSEFVVRYREKIVNNNFCNHATLACDKLVPISEDYGFFEPKNISTQFEAFTGIKQKSSNNNTNNKSEITYYAQWIFWTIILIVAILLLWFLMSNNAMQFAKVGI